MQQVLSLTSRHLDLVFSTFHFQMEAHSMEKPRAIRHAISASSLTKPMAPQTLVGFVRFLS